MPTEAIIAGFTAISAAIVALWVKQVQCEKDREAMHREQAEFRELIGAVRLCHHKDCPIHESYSIS